MRPKFESLVPHIERSLVVWLSLVALLWKLSIVWIVWESWGDRWVCSTPVLVLDWYRCHVKEESDVIMSKVESRIKFYSCILHLCVHLYHMSTQHYTLSFLRKITQKQHCKIGISTGYRSRCSSCFSGHPVHTPRPTPALQAAHETGPWEISALLDGTETEEQSPVLQKETAAISL